MWKLGAPALLLILAGFGVAYLFVDPAPPSRLTLASGERGGAYALFADRYRDLLAEHDIELVLRETSGSQENLSLLRSGEVDAAFVQGGVATDADRDVLESLGSLYYEPLWVFQRRGLGVELLSDLAGLLVAAGPKGSGTRSVALQLLEANGVTGGVSALPTATAVESLREGALDVVFLVASPKSASVQALLAADEVELFSFVRAAAYERTHRFLSGIELPRGVIDYAADVPPRDVTLVSPTANLVVGNDLHPALIDLLVQAAARVHGAGGIFEAPGSFPTPRYRDLPLNAEAQRFYEQGPSFLQRYLPFWLATLVDRLWVMLIPLIALLIPLGRIFPPVYRWRVRWGIYRWYKELKLVDPLCNPATDPAAALADVERIESEVAHVQAPDSYGEELYNLRVHLELVRARLREVGSVPVPASPALRAQPKDM